MFQSPQILWAIEEFCSTLNKHSIDLVALLI